MKNFDKNKLTTIAILSISIYSASNAIIGGMLPFMEEEFGISREASEFLVSLSAFFTVIAIALSERITRRIGMKKTVEIGLLLIGISAFIPIVSTTYPGVFISRIILGFGIGLYNGNSVNYISASFDSSRSNTLYGIRNSMEYIGQILLLLIAGLFIKISWVLGFLAYAFALVILVFFNRNVEDVKLTKSDERFNFNGQVIFYMVFAGLTIMNIAAINIRFPTVAKASLGMDANINMYMTTMPFFGMIAGFYFGKINRKLKELTIFLGLATYIISNLLIGFWGDTVAIFLLGMALNSFSQSMCAPYIFAEVARFSKGESNRIVNNLIFIGCNIGGFLASLYLNLVDKTLGNISLTLSFVSFSLIFTLLFIFYLSQYTKTRYNF